MVEAGRSAEGSSCFAPCRDHEERFRCSDLDLFNAERFGL